MATPSGNPAAAGGSGASHPPPQLSGDPAAAGGSGASDYAPQLAVQLAAQLGVPAPDLTLQATQTHLRVLVHQNDFELVYGEYGKNLDEASHLCKVRNRFSNEGEYFPGTKSRILMIAGTLEGVSAGTILMIVDKLLKDDETFGTKDAPDAVCKVQFIVPSTCSDIMSMKEIKEVHDRVQKRDVNACICMERTKRPSLKQFE